MSYSTVVSGSSEQLSQVAEDHRQLAERVDAQQRDNEALHRELNTLKALITHTLVRHHHLHLLMMQRIYVEIRCIRFFFFFFVFLPFFFFY